MIKKIKLAGACQNHTKHLRFNSEEVDLISRAISKINSNPITNQKMYWTSFTRQACGLLAKGILFHGAICIADLKTKEISVYFKGENCKA